jgi:hypothetical protein
MRSSVKVNECVGAGKAEIGDRAGIAKSKQRTPRSVRWRRAANAD